MTPSLMESPRLLDKMMLLVNSLIRTIIKEMDLLNMKHSQTIPNQEKLINKAITPKAETHNQDPVNHLKQDNEEEMILGTVAADVGLTVTIDKINVKIEEILILKLSLKSTSLELFEISVKKILKNISLLLERLKTSR